MLNITKGKINRAVSRAALLHPGKPRIMHREGASSFHVILSERSESKDLSRSAEHCSARSPARVAERCSALRRAAADWRATARAERSEGRPYGAGRTSARSCLPP